MTRTTEDGRVARGTRTREAVIDALLDLFREGNLNPATDEIAARIGLTSRAIYHHFQDKEALAAAIAHQLLTRHKDLFAARPASGSLSERIHAIVAHRAEFFETVTPWRRSAVIRLHHSPELQNQQEFLITHLRNQLARTFEPELSALDLEAASDTLELLDLHTSWELWDRLRRLQRLSVERSHLIVFNLVTQVLKRH